MKFYITYPKQKPGIKFETFEAKEYREAFQHAADSANGWGFSIETEVSASYVVRLNGRAVFYFSRKDYAEDFSRRVLAAENEVQNKTNAFYNISLSVEEC